jgi:Tol biopolymer transport system component
VSIYDIKTRQVHDVFVADQVWEAPSWSPDGQRLLVNSGGSLYEIPVAGAQAGKPSRIPIPADLKCNNDKGYAPDGQSIGFSVEYAITSGPWSRRTGIFRAVLDGSSLQQLGDGLFHGFSPDGRLLTAIVRDDAVAHLVSRRTADGQDERALTSVASRDSGPDYSPDGKWIYFNSNRSGNFDIWRMPAAGAGPGDRQAQQVTSDAWQDWFPHPSPDGRHLLFISYPSDITTHNARLNGVALRMMELPGQKLTPASIETLLVLYGGQGTLNSASWAPDSSRFAFVRFEELTPR